MQNGAKQNQIALIWCVLLVQDKFCWQVSVQIVPSGYKARGVSVLIRCMSAGNQIVIYRLSLLNIWLNLIELG